MLLPDTLRSAACRSGREWGWQPEAIPLVIDEAEKLGLLNVGGQLQFLMPEGICECYWVEVNALIGEPDGLTWVERVAFSAVAARQQMVDISLRYDFVEEGRKAFADPFAAYEATGGNVGDRMCFIWYLQAEPPVIASPPVYGFTT
ncbi:hypothetical protein ELH82_19450 [Rhizobium leguminosarum]|nr:hypothetical protein ELH82_04510 [Rhizobium leguminosarum]TAY69653.1 hypothetical protein ELH82_19450 [Rhizobium leguminosarum]